MIEIAPNVFVKSWDEVINGYLHGSGVFVIKLANGQCINVQGDEDIKTTLNLWKSSGVPIPEEAASKVPEEINLWLPYATEKLVGKIVF